MNLSSAHLSQKFYGGGGGENGFKEGRDDTAAGISSIKPFFNQEVVIVSMSIVTAWHDLEKQGPLQFSLVGLRYAIEHTQLDIVVHTQCVQLLIQHNVRLFV